MLIAKRLGGFRRELWPRGARSSSEPQPRCFLPLYLRAWSTVMYGEWMALSAMAYYLLNCDFGLTAATLNAATMAYARGIERNQSVRYTAWAISVAIAGVALLCVAIAVFILPIHDWLRFKALSVGDVRWTTVLLAGVF